MEEQIPNKIHSVILRSIIIISRFLLITDLILLVTATFSANSISDHVQSEHLYKKQMSGSELFPIENFEKEPRRLTENFTFSLGVCI